MSLTERKVRNAGSRLRGQQDRQRRIAETVMAEGTIRIEDIAERFEVSVMTVHRDLDDLQAQGLLRKTRGQVTAVASSLFESNTAYRVSHQVAEKRALATGALELIEPGQAIMMDDSTTGIYLAQLLPSRTPTTVITNFLGVVRELTEQPEVSLICLGGTYYQWCDAFMGGLTLDLIGKLRPDIFFMSTSAITSGMCFHQTQDTVMVKHAMFNVAARRVLYVDHTKFTRRALHALVPLTAFDEVIVDWQTPDSQVRALRSDGVSVIVAQPESD